MTPTAVKTALQAAYAFYILLRKEHSHNVKLSYTEKIQLQKLL